MHAPRHFPSRTLGRQSDGAESRHAPRQQCAALVARVRTGAPTAHAHRGTQGQPRKIHACLSSQASRNSDHILQNPAETQEHGVLSPYHKAHHCTLSKEKTKGEKEKELVNSLSTHAR